MAFGYDSIADELERVLAALATGADTHGLETKHVDLKEEAGRRGKDGSIAPSQPRSEEAAKHLAAEAACMSNSDGGGALVVGAADDGTLIGTDLDPDWLRARIYELTDGRLTVDVNPVILNEARLLVVRAPQAVEAVRYRGKITWRVGDTCREVDQNTWTARRMSRERYDWSAQDSGLPLDSVRPQALTLAREHLLASGDTRSEDLANASDTELLRRLDIVTSNGTLTHAGVITFVGHDDAPLDYVRRDVRAGDSRRRLRTVGRSLLEVVDEVEKAVDAFTEERHVQRGLVVGRVRDLPLLAVREAIVNGVVHRDWHTPAPTVVEHIGRTLTVTSPGGFVGGVTPQNIITHPSQPRNRALAEIFAKLRLAEREGIGVDRMYREMISVGYPEPSITQTEGPYVRTALVGERLDEGWIRFLSRLTPAAARSDLTMLMLLRKLVHDLWVDAASTVTYLQLDETETRAALSTLATLTAGDAPIAVEVAGIPADAAPAWTLSAAARTLLASDDEAAGTARRAPDRAATALAWARARGRVSTTELASIVGAHPTNVSPVLRGLEDKDLLAPSRPTRSGRGFYYFPVDYH